MHDDTLVLVQTSRTSCMFCFKKSTCLLHSCFSGGGKRMNSDILPCIRTHRTHRCVRLSPVISFVKRDSTAYLSKALDVDHRFRQGGGTLKAMHIRIRLDFLSASIDKSIVESFLLPPWRVDRYKP